MTPPIAPLAEDRPRSDTPLFLAAIARLLAIALLWALLASQARAATAPVVFVPGSAPCGDRCGHDWAMALTGAPNGRPRPMIMPAGARITHMAYAGDGPPRMSRSPMVNLADQAGIGYTFSDGDQTMVMFRVAACGNWAIYQAAPGMGRARATPVSGLTPMPRFTGRPISRSGIGIGIGGGTPSTAGPPTDGNSSGTTRPSWSTLPGPPSPTAEPPAPLPVPLPAPMALLAAAILSLRAVRRRGSPAP